MATTTVTLYQFKRALAAQGLITSFSQAISAEVSDPVNIAWWTADTVTVSDVLYSAVQSTFSYSAAQMQALMDLAATYTTVSAPTTSGTLAAMKARIADELARTDLGSNISLAISDAITFYQRKRFYFNETGPNGSIFYTVANQTTYTASDDADIPYMFDLDDVFITVGVNNYTVQRIDPTQWRILQIPTFKGQPYQYMFLNQTISFAPTPDQAYQMQLVGHYKLAAPASDTEASNHWMTDAERLIRSCAKRLLCQEVILDADAAAAAKAAEDEAFDDLKSVTSTMVRTGSIRPMAL